MPGRVVLEAIKGVKTVNQIAWEYEIHPVMVSNEKKEMLSHLPDVFDKDKCPQADKEIAKEKEQLQRRVGELRIDVEFLEQSADGWESPSKIGADRKRFSHEYPQTVPPAAYSPFKQNLYYLLIE